MDELSPFYEREFYKHSWQSTRVSTQGYGDKENLNAKFNYDYTNTKPIDCYALLYWIRWAMGV